MTSDIWYMTADIDNLIFLGLWLIDVWYPGHYIISIMCVFLSHVFPIPCFSTVFGVILWRKRSFASVGGLKIHQKHPMNFTVESYYTFQSGSGFRNHPQYHSNIVNRNIDFHLVWKTTLSNWLNGFIRHYIEKYSTYMGQWRFPKSWGPGAPQLSSVFS